MGVEKDGTHGPNYAPGMALMGKYVLIGEGARGSLAKQLIARYGLSQDREPAKFGIGLKELWQVTPENHKPGLVQHSFGWPLDFKTGGGSFLYHLEDNLVAVGFVVHLNYKNPYLSPFEDSSASRPIRPSAAPSRAPSASERRPRHHRGGGSLCEAVLPGGVLMAARPVWSTCRASGLAQCGAVGHAGCRAVAEAIAGGRANDELTAYEAAWRDRIGNDLKKVRNVKPLWSRFGTVAGVAVGGLDMWLNTLFGFSPFGTLKHGKTDAASLEPASKHRKIAYPKPDGVLTFDRLSSVFLSNTNHEENEPVHLLVGDMELQKRSEHDVFAGPSTRYCPAGVYEWVDADGNAAADPSAKDVRFVINAQNCVHCKTCDIKDPNQNITWVPPQGGEGPVYQNM